jgi:threonine/homoserine/homoserine lactone efflux protein
MVLLAYLVQGIGFGFAAAAQPGPLQTFVISRALAVGWRRALPAACAPLVSDGPIILLVLFVLSQVPASFRAFLQIAGGLFILFLAWSAFRTWSKLREAGPEIAAPSGTEGNAGRKSLLRAALMNALSPGPYLFWSLVTGPLLLRAWGQNPGYGLSFLAGFYAAMIGTLAAIIITFGKLRELGPRVSRALLGISAIALAGFGFYQLAQGIAATLQR